MYDFTYDQDVSSATEARALLAEAGRPLAMLGLRLLGHLARRLDAWSDDTYERVAAAREAGRLLPAEELLARETARAEAMRRHPAGSALRSLRVVDEL